MCLPFVLSLVRGHDSYVFSFVIGAHLSLLGQAWAEGDYSTLGLQHPQFGHVGSIRPHGLR